MGTLSTTGLNYRAPDSAALHGAAAGPICGPQTDRSHFSQLERDQTVLRTAPFHRGLQRAFGRLTLQLAQPAGLVEFASVLGVVTPHWSMGDHTLLLA